LSKIIVHIGPPKTATTSIQQFYMGTDLSVCNGFYIGVIQPRKVYNKNGSNDLVNLIKEFSKTGNPAIKKLITSELDKLFIQ